MSCIYEIVTKKSMQLRLPAAASPVEMKWERRPWLREGEKCVRGEREAPLKNLYVMKSLEMKRACPGTLEKILKCLCVLFTVIFLLMQRGMWPQTPFMADVYSMTVREMVHSVFYHKYMASWNIRRLILYALWLMRSISGSVYEAFIPVFSNIPMFKCLYDCEATGYIF